MQPTLWEKTGREPWYSPHNPSGLELTVFEHELCIERRYVSSGRTPPPRRQAGDIKRFSKKSRLRIFRLFNQVNTRLLSTPLFITLTARHQSMSPEQFRDGFANNYLRRVKDLIPKAVYVWRLEAHQDGYPHFHMFVWSENREADLSDRELQKRLRQAWWKIINDESQAARQHSCLVQTVDSHRKTMSYVAKYTAKEMCNASDNLVGRRWGASSNLPRRPITRLYIDGKKEQLLKNAVKRILSSNKKRLKSFKRAVENRKCYFIWLDSAEIREVLRLMSRLAESNQVHRYSERGSPAPDLDYITKLADEFAQQ